MNIKRARGHRLYTQKGERILDLSMDYGQAVLGYRGRYSLYMKQLIDRGVYPRYRSVEDSRLEKFLEKEFPDYPFIKVIESEALIKGKILDPLLDGKSGDIGYWRPFIEAPNYNTLIIKYPLPGITSPAILVSKEDIEYPDFSPSPIISGGILRSLYDYKKALDTYNEKGYEPFRDIPGTTFNPPYLVFNMELEKYKELCQRAFLNGILLNTQGRVNILPPDYSPGEIKKVLKTLKE